MRIMRVAAPVLLALVLLLNADHADGARVQVRDRLMQEGSQTELAAAQSSWLFGSWDVFGWFRGKASSAVKAVRNTTLSAAQTLSDLRAQFQRSASNARNMTVALWGNVTSLQDQLQAASDAKKAEISQRLEQMRSKLRKARQTLSEGLFGSAAFAATDAADQWVKELNEAKNLTGDRLDQARGLVARLQARVAVLRAAVAQKGSALGAASANATEILAERIGQLSEFMQELNATATAKGQSVAAQIAMLQLELAKIDMAVRTRGQQIGEDVLNSTIALSAEVAEIKELLANATDVNSSWVNASRVAELRERLALLEAHRARLNASAWAWTLSTSAALDALYDNTAAQARELQGRLQNLGNATGEEAQELRARLARVQSYMVALNATRSSATVEAHARLDALLTNASETLGQLRARVRTAVGAQKEELQAQLAMLQLRMDTLAESAGNARAAASAQLTAVGRSVSERIGQARELLLNATADGRQQLQGEMGNLTDFLRQVWSVADNYTSPAASAARRVVDFLNPPTVTVTAAPAEGEQVVQKKSLWRRLTSWIFG